MLPQALLVPVEAASWTSTGITTRELEQRLLTGLLDGSRFMGTSFHAPISQLGSNSISDVYRWLVRKASSNPL